MKKIRALTLLELLVAIGISVLILAVSLPLFKYEKKGALVQNEAEMLASYLETARSLAIHPESENATAYKVSWGADGVINTSSVVGSVVTDLVDKKLILNYLCQNESPNESNSISFTSYSGEFSENTAVDIELCLKDSDSVYKTVKISKPGIINILPQ